MQNLNSFKHFSNFSLNHNASNLSLYEIQYPLVVLDSVAYVFNSFVPITKLPDLQIILDSSRSNPTCFRQLGTIYLSSRPTSWSKIAYQFAHELCHYAIPNNVTPELRWLEESICELSSYYFLPEISKYWEQDGINLETADGDLYYPYFTSYVEDDKQKATPFDLSFIANPNSDDFKQLTHDCYIRDKNSYIAVKLLPIFKEDPKTWLAIPHLCDIKPNQTLYDALMEWISLSPAESHQGLLKIIQLFSAES